MEKLNFIESIKQGFNFVFKHPNEVILTIAPFVLGLTGGVDLIKMLIKMPIEMLIDMINGLIDFVNFWALIFTLGLLKFDYIDLDEKIISIILSPIVIFLIWKILLLIPKFALISKDFFEKGCFDSKNISSIFKSRQFEYLKIVSVFLVVWLAWQFLINGHIPYFSHHPVFIIIQNIITDAIGTFIQLCFLFVSAIFALKRKLLIKDYFIESFYAFRKNPKNILLAFLGFMIIVVTLDMMFDIIFGTYHITYLIEYILYKPLIIHLTILMPAAQAAITYLCFENNKKQDLNI